MCKRHPHLISTVLLLTVLLVACSRNDSSPPQGENENTPAIAEPSEQSTDGTVRADGLFQIVATTTQAADIAKILTQGIVDIEITALMGAGVDPHLYQPTESDVAAMNGADLIIYSGLHLEGQFDIIFEALREQGQLIYSLSQPVKEAGFVIGAFNAQAALLGPDDPHFWFDPRNWEVTTTDLAETFAQLDPANSDAYLASAQGSAQQTRPAWATSRAQSILS